MNTGWFWVAVSVVAPALWGVAMVFVFGALERRARRSRDRGDPPPIDYSI